MGPHHFGKLDPDPHHFGKLDPDPHQCDADPSCLSYEVQGADNKLGQFLSQDI